ncbi:unnamed protein product [Dracunculus medinensis]|uniref:SET domain-containing protein n=1 Tax=Dracunculus medinensis TaxID=318479 RepID=A0A0N4U2Y4_DRAME|nr:unnamed protein product [Dracunculus medinensis]
MESQKGHKKFQTAILFLEYGARPIELSNDMKVPSSFRSFLDRISKKFASLRILSVPRHYISHDIAKGNEKVPIPVIGNILGDSFPLDFEYTPYACSCLNFCQSGCPCISRSIYNANGRLSDEVIALADTSNLGVIIECNSSCFCSSSCKSKIAQRGIRHRLEIFRSSKYGWAVRSAVPISKGDFICEYTGELISNEEADRREVDTYLFEIVENSIIYCIDARNKGNVARFVNHSCDANLLVLKVVWDANVRHFPHICFFAKRDIQKAMFITITILQGEELTIDYGRQWWDVKRKYFSCLCGSSACRYRETLSDQESNQNLIFPY